jgi:hypothetical protein
MVSRPTGTVTFLLPDIEGSTKLAQAHPAEWEAARQRYHRHHAPRHRSPTRSHLPDRRRRNCAAFATAPEALQAALSVQRALQTESWSETPIRVRIGAEDQLDISIGQNLRRLMGSLKVTFRRPEALQMVRAQRRPRVVAVLHGPSDALLVHAGPGVYDQKDRQQLQRST